MIEMKSKMEYASIRLFSIVGFLLFIGINISGCIDGTGVRQSATGTDQNVVRLAANLPLTGDLATFGTSIHDGIAMALDDLRESKPGSPRLIIDWQDNVGAASTAVSIAQKQLFQSPDIYISGVHPSSMAIKDMIAAKGLPHFLWIFDLFLNSETDVSAPNNCFRTWVNFKIEPPLFLNYAKEHKSKRVAIVYVRLPGNTETEYERFVIPGLKQMGIKDLFVESYDASTKDFKDIAVKVQNFHPDLVIFCGFPKQEVATVRALRPLNLIKDANTLTSYDMLDVTKVLGKDELEGIRVTAPIFITRPDSEKVRRWTERFQARTHRSPLYTDAYAYDSIMMIYDAAKRLNLPASSKQWIDALRATNINGITGPLSFDDDGSLKTPVELAVFRNGALVPDMLECKQSISVRSATPRENARRVR